MSKNRKFPLKVDSYEDFFKSFPKNQGSKAYLEAKALAKQDPILNRDKILTLSGYVLSSQDPEFIYRFAKRFHNLIDVHTYVEKVIESCSLKNCYFVAKEVPGLSPKEILLLQNVLLEADPNTRKILKISCTWGEIARYCSFFMRDVPGANVTSLLNKIQTALSQNLGQGIYLNDFIESIVAISSVPGVSHKFITDITLSQSIPVAITLARRISFLVEPLAVKLMAFPDGKRHLEALLKGKGPRKLRGLLRQDILDKIATFEVVNS